MNFNGLTFSRPRILAVAGAVLLVVVGSVLPYLRLDYIDYTVQLTHFHASLFPSATFVRGVDPVWLPSYSPGPQYGRLQLALNVFNLGPSFHQIGAVVAVLTLACLFQDEINKFFWWPLHLAGWLLAIAVLPLVVGLVLLRQADVTVGIDPGFVPLTLAGILVLWATFRSHKRIDTYASI
ncbi:MAG: hypothetical protein JWP61_2070 [Friedmanniella sp.]|nr:hypothetical protein [Friedmanniella sp.]